MSYQKAYSQSIAKPRHQACIIYSDSFIRVPIWVLDGSGCTVAFMLIGDHLPIPHAGHIILLSSVCYMFAIDLFH